ncbi:putative UDP-rhamnose:rhamnosyltransferase 1 [Jatropha curcas]|uniref:putative UDP-rhamnose:rhamnosyltransferase 1 n=1 Tax=Jatropha curcas TaxID=180498 RepID=UPI001893D661|nr:putative UDP-rhamnose:rhamnosyltransferase 1 [Jatropha curcas]
MNEHKKLHIALFPWLAFGHIIPFLELAKLLAKRGHKISFISTPKNIHRLPKIPPNLANLVHLVTLTLPSEDHLPPNSEATTDIPTHKVPYLKKAYDNLQCPLLQFLETSTPDWIIYDFSPFWLPRITADLGISSAFFSIFGGWTLTFFGSSSAMINGDDLRTQAVDFTVPPKWVPFPSKVAFRLHEAKKLLSHVQVNDSDSSDGFLLGSVMAGCDVIAIRSCL